MIVSRALAIVLLAAAVDAAAQERVLNEADERTPRVVIAPFVGDADSNLGTLHDGSGIYLSFGRPWTRGWSWAAAFAYANLETDTDAGTDFYQASTGFEAERRFGRGERLATAIATLDVNAARVAPPLTPGDIATHLARLARLGCSVVRRFEHEHAGT
jgi:hypothetical protein